MENRSSLVIAFLMGVIVTLGFALLSQNDRYLPAAYADGGSGGSSGIFMVTNNGTSAQGKDMLFLVESTDLGKRLAIYEYAGGRLELGAVRNIDYDLRFESWSKKGNQQKPSVKEQKKNSERADEDDKKSRR